MKILFLTSVPPYPATNGYRIRVSSIGNFLARRHEIHYLSFDDVQLSSNEFYAGSSIDVVPNTGTTLFKLFANIFSKLPLHAFLTYDKKYASELTRLLENDRYDVIYCHFVWFFVYKDIFLKSNSLLIVDQHNLDRDYWCKKSQNESSWFRRFFSKINYYKVVEFENYAYPVYDLIVTCSGLDEASMQKCYPDKYILNVNNGVDIGQFSKLGNVGKINKSLLFVGSGVPMNIQAINYFVSDILPLIVRKVPDVMFYIVGNISLDDIKEAAQHPNVHYVGPQDDIRKYFWGCEVFVAPFKLGGGSKLKIAEAMSAKIPIVSTTVGVQGFDIYCGEHVLLADDPNNFSNAVVSLLMDSSLRSTLTDNAYKYVSENHNWENLVGNLEAKMLDLCSARKL